jgi:hypothetical protein
MLNAMESPEIGQEAKVSRVPLAARRRVLQPFQRPTPRRRRALLWGGLAIVALAAFGIAAALPGVHGGLRLGLGASGYLSFVLLFRRAMKCWRTDWDELWDDGRYRRWRPGVFEPSIDAGLDAAPTASLAQQKILNARRSPVSGFEADRPRGAQRPR